jgi:hypothetical protein
MHRNHVSYRRVRAVRRTEIQFHEVERFTGEFLTASLPFPLIYIANADESMWLMFWQPRKTVREKDVEGMKEW